MPSVTSPSRRTARWAPVAVLIGLAIAPGAAAAAVGAAGTTTTGLLPGPSSRLSYTATPALDQTRVYAAPGGRGRSILRLHTGGAATNDPLDLLGDGLLILGSKADSRGHVWYRIQLLQRPRGRSGYIDSDLALVTSNPYRVVVRLARRTVTVYRSGRMVRRASAVVGAPATPTPVGLFAIAKQIDCVQFRCGSGFVGSAINLLTAYSPVYQDIGFDGGAGIVAIHGRGVASLGDPLGSARSHGCVRVQNGAATWILKTLTPGTPVRIQR